MYQVPRAGPFSSVISQDHISPGPAASSPGFFRAGREARAALARGAALAQEPVHGGL
jgi:hypothetical protein